MIVISLAHFDRSSTASEPSRQKGGIQGNPRQRERPTQQTDQISPSLELRRNLLSEYLATSIQRRIRETDPQVRTMVIMYVMYVSVWLILVKNCAKCCMVFEHYFLVLFLSISCILSLRILCTYQIACKKVAWFLNILHNFFENLVYVSNSMQEGCMIFEHLA